MIAMGIVQLKLFGPLERRTLFDFEMRPASLRYRTTHLNVCKVRQVFHVVSIRNYKQLHSTTKACLVQYRELLVKLALSIGEIDP